MPARPKLLNENEVIAAVERAFAAQGYTTVAKSDTTQTGVDLQLSKPSGKDWRIEAKGATSAAETSKRFGKPFTQSQVGVHVAKAIHQAMCLRAQHRKSGVAVALPDDTHHRKEISAVGNALDLLDIRVIWVAPDGVAQLPTNL
jgi:hypothetical protein